MNRVEVAVLLGRMLREGAVCQVRDGVERGCLSRSRGGRSQARLILELHLKVLMHREALERESDHWLGLHLRWYWEGWPWWAAGQASHASLNGLLSAAIRSVCNEFV